MRLHVVDFKAFYAGLFFAAIGAAAFVLSHQYEIGAPLNMGPGFFPALVGIALAGLGGVSMVQGVRASIPNVVDQVRITPVLLVLAGVISFALLIERTGLLVALAALLGFSCFDRLKTRPLEILLVYLVLAAFSAGLFVYGFRMSIRLVWWQ
jgi:Tripartite tricarboxylate transporter TctB family